METNNVLVTPTLLDKFEFVKNAPPSWKDRAWSGFVQMIRREPGDWPLWIQKGRDLEDAIYAQCRKAKTLGQDEVTVGTPNFQKIANACIGGEFQSVLKKEILVNGEPVLYYGKTDVKYDDKIKDIKTTLNWKGQDKYLNGWQHILYLWMADITDFEYIIAIWRSETSDEIASVEFVPYKPFSFGIEPDFEYDIKEATKELFEFLHKKNLYLDYYHTFSNNK